MRLIDADALYKKLLEELHNRSMQGFGKGLIIANSCVINAPTIEPRCETCEAFNKTRLLIPQPQRKKGKWIKITTGAMREKYMCSICGRTIEEDGIERLVRIRYPFCHCGADMREDGADETR